MTPPPLLPAPLYQGSVNTWECDDGGHLNVRFQLERLHVGLMHMAHALAMPGAFAADASATMTPLDLHVRFHKEALPGAILSMHGAVIEIGVDDATLCCDVRHGDQAPATSFTLRVAHDHARTLKRFPWSTRTRAAAAALRRPLPDHAKPRSIDTARAPCDATLARAIEAGAMRIGAAAVLPDQCDAFGRLRFEHLLGRVSDSVPNLLNSWRAEAATNAAIAPAGAVVEGRLAIRQLPCAGDLIEIYSGVAEISGKTLRLVHWLCDPVSGGVWASLEAITLTFDVATRKTVTPSESARAAMQKRVVALAI